MMTPTNSTAMNAIRILALAGVCLAGGSIAAGQAPPLPGPTVSSSWSVTRSENGQSFTISSVDGKLSGAIDGRAVPADRLRSENGKVAILDENGRVIFEQDSPASGLTILGGEPGVAERRDFRFSRQGPRGLLDQTLRGPEAAKAEAPSVMVGVQLVEPDTIIRGHFGLKEGDATMVAAVYDGLPAQKAGLKPYDLIVSIDGKSPASANTVREAFRSRQPGQAITVEVLQKGERKSITITPEKYDAARMDDAKVDAIATADDWGNLSRRGNNLGFIGGQPFVLTMPAPGGGGGAPGQMLIGPEHQAIQRQAEEWARRLQQLGVAPGNPGNAGLEDLNKAMEDRMRRMEEMMQRMMDRQNAQPQKKDDKTSRRDVHFSSLRVS